MNIKGQYLTYDEFVGLGGTLDNASFNLLEFKARKIIDKYTLGRLQNLSSQIEEVKLCIYDLIKSSLNESDNKDVSSESIDGYSISYKTQNTEEIEKEEQNLIENYLSNCYLEDGTPYLYRGIEC